MMAQGAAAALPQVVTAALPTRDDDNDDDASSTFDNDPTLARVDVTASTFAAFDVAADALLAGLAADEVVHAARAPLRALDG